MRNNQTLPTDLKQSDNYNLLKIRSLDQCCVRWKERNTDKQTDRQSDGQRKGVLHCSQLGVTQKNSGKLNLMVSKWAFQEKKEI